ncbi:MAG: SpoIIE family protein phosphatase [Bacteroidota bacterium]
MIKRIILFALIVVIASPIKAQSNFILKGVVMMDNKLVKDATVLVYENSKFIDSARTSITGKFRITLKTQKEYVLSFKKTGLPVKRVQISTVLDKSKSNGITTKPIIFSLNSMSAFIPGKTKKIETSFAINENGLFIESEENFSKEVKKAENKENDKEKEVAEKKDELEELKEDMNPDDEAMLNSKYQQALIEIDNLLMLSKQKAALIVNTARLKSAEIISNAYLQIPDIVEKSDESIISTSSKTDLNKIGVKEKGFYERDDIKKYQETINKMESNVIKSKKDSVHYLESMVMFKEEIVKTAKLQLALDKMNVRSREDSIELQNRQVMIYLVEQEIEEAKHKIAIQQMEIKNKNQMLMFSIAGLLFFIILFIVVYQNYRLKQKTNARLAAQNEEIAKKNKKIIDSITYAKTIQQAILPIKTKVDKYFETFIIFEPKDIVSGDFYWFTHFKDTNTTIFAVIDCTGHGVPGAFMSMIGNRLLVEVVNEKNITEPKEILEGLDQRLHVALMQDETMNNDGMDMCVCKIQHKKNGQRKIDFAGAKRPLFYSNNNKINFLKGTVRGIGGRARLRKKPVKQFESHTINLNKGDYLYLTTDGFLDLQSPSRRKYGRKNFMELLKDNMNKPTNEQHNSIVNALNIHKGNELQIDDITILGVKV